MKLIIATKNENKIKEIRACFAGGNISPVSLNRLKKKFLIKEDGDSFLSNATKKALAVSRLYPGVFVAGEDSGLQVDYLSGRPGVYSRRYCGRGSTDLKNNRRILKELEGVSGRKRGAQFCCCIVLAKCGKVVKSFEGKIRGVISLKGLGENGFGYDPIFYLPGHKKTMAQVSLRQKNQISHRAAAFKKLNKFFKSRRGFC